MMEIANVPECLFSPEQQCCGVGIVIVVVEDELRIAADIVLQPVNQNVESRFDG